MKHISAEIERIIQQDPGSRGLESWAIRGEFLPAVESLANAKHVLIATGFYILSADVIETDGPPGAIVLSDVLSRSGKEVTLVVDDHSEEILRKGLDQLGSDAGLEVVPSNGDYDLYNLISSDTTHFIALERPGRASDGGYYNFRGVDISKYHMTLDDFFIDCGIRGITTIGIGDGGNELGMGKVSDRVDRFVPFDRPFSCKTDANYAICAGVSNWAGYGMSALLSRISGKNLMHEPEMLEELLDALVAAGAVDGVSGKKEATVDGLDAYWEHGIYRKMYEFAL